MKEIKRLRFEMDAGRCRHCGSSEDLGVLQLVPRKGKLGWRLSNLITLCSECKLESEQTKLLPDTNRVGVVLCGGRGTRLAPLTLFTNKHVLPLGLIPTILYPIKTLRKFGIKRVLVVTDRSSTGEISSILGSGKEFGMSFSYKIQEGSGGISDALYLAKDFTKPGDEIVCILGDNIFDGNLDTNVSLDGETKACVWLKEVDNPKDYGVAEVKAGRVINIVEKPQNPKTNTAVLGLYMYDYDVFDVISNTTPSDRGELEISAVNDYYAKSGELTFKDHNNYWIDCGSSIQKYCEASLHGAKQAKVSKEEASDFISVVFDDK